MRVLRPEVAKEREEKILRWIIQEYVETRRPVASEMIAKHALPGLSSATIRNIMKKLEDEGYLEQVHTSGGRIPTDKAYRFYVDYISKIQKVAAKERTLIEQEYDMRMAEVEKAMLHASRVLSMISQAAGFVLPAPAVADVVQRLDFIPLGPANILVVLVTESGIVRHWPIQLSFLINPMGLRAMSHFINEQISGLPLQTAQRVLWEMINSGRPELGEMADLARRVLADIEENQLKPSELYLEGVSQLLDTAAEEDNYEGFKQMMKVIEEKDQLSHLLAERMHDMQKSNKKISVSIGSENEIAGLENLSIVSSAYKIGDKTIGMLGIIGPKHMEYNRMMNLVNFVSELLEGTINNWRSLNAIGEEDDG
ncbi:heat-inducible transcriptional repressor [Parelusimicrobium proximum]|uniref:heat-inducible transcriptional repressor HrcA n=1 Tax=Parelusimicrobium proximum TaxID=3228953 RepID=UPI003D172560